MHITFDETNLPDFMTPFDSAHPAPGYAEQLHATFELRSAVEDTVLSLLPALDSKERHAGVYAELRLDSYDLAGEPAKVIVECADTTAFPDLPAYTLSLTVGPRQLDGTHINRHDYSIPAAQQCNQVATRRDVHIPKLPRLKFSFPTLVKTEETPSMSAETAQKLIGIFEEARRNQELEKGLGINDQPIGISEARAVALIISRATIEQPRISDKKDAAP